MATLIQPPAGDIELRLAAARHAERTGAWDRALEEFEAAFRAAANGGDVRTATEVLRWIGTVHRERGDLDLARDVYDASLAVARANRMDDQVAPALSCLAAIEQLEGRPRVADRLYHQARELAERAHDGGHVAIVQRNLGALANIRGDIGEALSIYDAALDDARATRDHRAMIAALNNMGMAYADLDDLAEAERCFDEAHALASLSLDSLSLAYVHVNRAAMYLKRQQYEQARGACDAALVIFSRTESGTGLAETYKVYGALYRETGRPHLAEIHLSLGLELAVGAQNRRLQAELSREMARVHQEQRRHRDAIRCLNDAYRLFREMQARRELPDAAEQVRELCRSYLSAVDAWGRGAIAGKDGYTLSHSRRVATYVADLGSALGLPEEDRLWLEVGALLHDVGKTVVPPALLSKAGALAPPEWELIKQHTLVGERIVAELGLPYPVESMARSHHERWDGLGYPDRLHGDAIPFDARVLAVADIYDALSTERPYHNAFSPVRAMKVMRAAAGRSLDPDLFRVFETDVWTAVPA